MGIEVSNHNNLDKIKISMDNEGIKYIYINDKDLLMSYLV